MKDKAAKHLLTFSFTHVQELLLSIIKEVEQLRLAYVQLF